MKRTTVLLMGWLALMAGVLSISLAQANDKLANATVSFGQWIADPATPLDRLTTNPGGGVGNNHEVLPNVVKIKAGGAVNFASSGLHNVQVYDDGTKPDDISTLAPLPGVGGGIINSVTNRIYRGWDPNTIPNNNQRDRVEVVQFPEPGIYLVICGVVNHFVNDNMYGFVRVLP